MARIRTIKPDFWGSPKTARASRDARLLFLGLLNEADDEGRLLGSARSIGGALFPHDDDFSDSEINACLRELERAGFVQLYTVDDIRYVLVVGFKEHQKVSHPTESRLPPPPGKASGIAPEPLPNASGEAPESFAPDLGTGNREQGTGNVSSASATNVTSPDVSDAFGADVVRLCHLLADRIEANGSKRPTVTKAWLTECDRMLRLDGRTPQQVENAIDWCQSDAFWRTVVLSMGKFREKYDQMRLAAKRTSNVRMLSPPSHPGDAEIARFLAEAGS